MERRWPVLSLFFAGLMRGAFLLFVSLLCLSVQSQWVFDSSVGNQFLYFSYAAYCDNSRLEDWTCKWCSEPSIAEFTPLALPDDPTVSASGFVGVHIPDELIVVSFKGSDDIDDYIADLQSIILVPYNNMTNVMVGKGFYKDWNALQGQVEVAVANATSMYPSFKIWVTGHSLGAAMSILCAAHLVEMGYEDISVYNYGLPRVGNYKFAEYYNALVPNTFRIVNGHDIVAHVPTLAMGFYHVSTEVWENPGESMVFQVCDGSGEDPKCSDGNFFNTSVDDHLNYYGILEGCDDDDVVAGL